MVRSILPLALFLTGTAFAQDTEIPSSGGFDAHSPFTPVGDGDLMDPLSLWRAERQAAGSGAMWAGFEYANAPLVLYRTTWDGVSTREPLLDQLVGVNVGGQYNPHERVGITVDMPLWLYSQDREGPQGAGLGDLTLAVPIGLVLPKDESFSVSLSAVPYGKAPTGTQAKYMGAGAFSGGGHLVTTLQGGRVSSSLQVGAEYLPEASVADITWGSNLRFGGSVGVQITEGFAMHVEASGRHILTEQPRALTGTPIEALLSARGRTRGGLRLHAGIGTGVTQGASAAVLRAFTGVGWTFGKDQARPMPMVVEETPLPPPPSDLDGDGWVDEVDPCIDEPEDGLGEAPEDGCPQPEQVASLVQPEPAPFDPSAISLPVVHFDFDDFGLRPDAKARLDEVVGVLKATPEITLAHIEGHTDFKGSDGYNDALSLRRAKTVKAYLMAAGISSSRLTIAGFGEDKPVASNDTSDGRFTNRRVEFRIEASGEQKGTSKD